MRILMVANAAAVHTHRWATAMAGRGHDVHVVSARDAPIPGVTVHATNPRSGDGVPALSVGYARLPVGLRRLHRSLRPDVVHAHYASTNGFAVSIAGIGPTVLTVWGSDVVPKPDSNMRRTQRWRARRAVVHADVTTSASRFMADHVMGIAPETDVRVVPFGVDLTRFQPVAPVAEPVIVAAKSLEDKYGFDVLIRAVSQLVHDLPGARLLVAGAGSRRSSLGRLAEDLGAPVDFVGFVQHADLPEFLGSGRVFVNPTIVDESFGVAPLEAQAMGLPVVATDVGAIRGVVLPDTTALLVPPGDVSAIADALSSVLAGHALGDARRAGPSFVAKRFDWEDSVVAMEDLYREVSVDG